LQKTSLRHGIDAEELTVLTKLKERVQKLMIAEAKAAHAIGLTPNQVSLLGILVTLVSAYYYWSSQSSDSLLAVAASLLLISGFFDALDGVLARTYGETTLFGGFLDSLLDRYSDAIILVSIILGRLVADSPVWSLVGFGAVIGSFLVSYSRARGEAAGVKMETVGLAERAERIIIIGVASFLNLLWADALRWGVLLLAVLTNLTVMQRAVYFWKASRKKEASATPVV
jgi:archaetidylinositol phosphate synthase